MAPRSGWTFPRSPPSAPALGKPPSSGTLVSVVAPRSGWTFPTSPPSAPALGKLLLPSSGTLVRPMVQSNSPACGGPSSSATVCRASAAQGWRDIAGPASILGSPPGLSFEPGNVLWARPGWRLYSGSSSLTGRGTQYAVMRIVASPMPFPTNSVDSESVAAEGWALVSADGADGWLLHSASGNLSLSRRH